jgi:hypothetical protein
MATISNLTLDIQVENDPNGVLVGNVTAAYRITWSLYDQESEQQYREVCKLIGDDTGLSPAEDGVDDAIPNGQLFPQLLFPIPLPGQPLIPVLLGTISSNGQPFVDRVHTKTIDLSDLNEDVAPLPDQDDLRAVVTLTPVLPATVTRESALFPLSIS